MKARRCGFCSRAIHVIEDFLVFAGEVFHHQVSNGINVHCVRGERKFAELDKTPYESPLGKKKKEVKLLPPPKDIGGAD